MFDSLDEQMKSYTIKGSSLAERMIPWVVAVVVAIVVLGGLYFVIRALEG